MDRKPQLANGDTCGDAPDGLVRLSRIARRLVAATLAYNLIEGVVALWAGSRAESSALVAFGFDSGIECAAALVLLWRLRTGHPSHDDHSEQREVRAHRLVGATFLLLAVYVLVEASSKLAARDAAGESVLGIILAGLSLLIMPGLALIKLSVAKSMGSGALRAEALETIACAYLSATLLIGLAANATFGWWWADPLAALLMVPWLLKEGREGLSGGCCGD